MSCKLWCGLFSTQICCAFAFFLALSFLLSTASAARIEINFLQLDIEYDGSTIVDADPGGDPEDPLSSTVLTVDGILAGPIFEDPTAATIDLSIPGVSGIPVGGTPGISSAAGGTLSLDFGGGEFLDLSLDAATISYTPITSTLQFVFGASVAEIVDQELPFDLFMGDPVSISFSTPITPGTLADDGSFLTAFVARGTGEIEGEFADDPDVIIPEPGCLVLALLAMLGWAGVNRRR